MNEHPLPPATEQDRRTDDEPLRFGSLGGGELSLQEENLAIALEKTHWVDQWAERVSEYFSAILVKESRQALKSRYFVWTYFLLLVVVVVWALFSLTIAFAEFGDRSNAGPFMLCGFFWILGFPLGIIVPYSTYRSLAHELEDGTLPLVAITTMRPYQIVAGKLGSSILQIIVYLSVLAPCIAFTYLLRGVDVIQIFYGLLMCVSGSITLCIIALFLASGTRTRMMSMAVSILLILGLVYVYAIWCIFSTGLTMAMASEMGFLLESGGKVVLWGFLTFAASTALLTFFVASAQIAFDTDNRSTPIRIAMIVQQTLFLGWSIALFCNMLEPEVFGVLSMVYCHYWAIMGAMMVATSPYISRKVMRSLPRTTAGQSFLSLLMPGPGRGYLFAVANIVACSITFAIVVMANRILLPELNDSFMFGPMGSVNFGNAERLEALGVIGVNLLYSVFFLTLVFFLMRGVQAAKIRSTPFVGALFLLLLMYGMMFTGFIIQYNLMPRSQGDYTPLQMGNWYWTFGEMMSGSNGDSVAVSLLTMGTITFVLVLLAVRLAAAELGFQRLATPARVQQEREAAKQSLAPVGETFEDIFNEPRADHPPSDGEPDSSGG